MTAAPPWLDADGFLHGVDPEPCPLDSPTARAWLQETPCAFLVQAGGTHYTVRPERKGDRTYWYAVRRCRGALHRVYLGLPTAITPARLQELAVEIADRCHEQAPTGTLDLRQAQATLMTARTVLDAQGRLGRQLGRQLLAFAEQALSILSTLQQPQEPAPQDEPPIRAQESVSTEPLAPPGRVRGSIRLTGATEAEILEQIAAQRAHYGDRLVMPSPRQMPDGSWRVYGMLHVGDPDDDEPSPEPPASLSVATLPAEPEQHLPPGLADEVERVAQIRQVLQRELDKQHDQKILNPKRAAVIIDLLRDALNARQRVLTLELLLDHLPALSRQDTQEIEESLPLLPLMAASTPAVQKLHDQVEDQATIVASSLTDSRKLIGRARTKLLGVAWKVYDELGTSRLQRLWLRAEDYGFTPARWVLQLEAVCDDL